MLALATHVCVLQLLLYSVVDISGNSPIAALALEVAGAVTAALGSILVVDSQQI